MFFKTKSVKFKTISGFTLVETLLAVSLLCVAITAPMLLTVQSLSSAYYARDEMTAYYLAQEGIEAIRAMRDSQILQIALRPASEAAGLDLFGSIAAHADGSAFTIDITDRNVQDCPSTCPPLRTNGILYAYNATTYPTVTNFTRTMHACYLQADHTTCNGNPTDEVRITATVEWKTGSYQTRSFSISEDLYRWVEDGSGA